MKLKGGLSIEIQTKIILYFKITVVKNSARHFRWQMLLLIKRTLILNHFNERC